WLIPAGRDTCTHTTSAVISSPSMIGTPAPLLKKRSSALRGRESDMFCNAGAVGYRHEALCLVLVVLWQGTNRMQGLYAMRPVLGTRPPVPWRPSEKPGRYHRNLQGIHLRSCPPPALRARGTQVRAPARPFLHGPHQRQWRCRCPVGLDHGLRRSENRLSPAVEAVGPSLPERDPRPGKPHQREHRHLDLAAPAACPAAAQPRRGPRDLHQRLRLYRAAAALEEVLARLETVRPPRLVRQRLHVDGQLLPD